jgi:stage II sporulation protein AA (anti-sigma F factor antagonist)
MKMQKENEITLEKKGEVTIMDIKGDITAFSDPFLNQAYQEATHLGNRKLILKSNKEAYINSGGIALLIQLLARIKSNNQQVVITGISDHFKKIFDMVGITKFAPIYDSEEAALQNLAAGTK